MAVIAGIVHPDRVKGNIADDHIEKVVGIACLLKTLDLDFCFWIELLCYLPGYRIQLHAVQLGVFHALRQHRIKVACSHGRV